MVDLSEAAIVAALDDFSRRAWWRQSGIWPTPSGPVVSAEARTDLDNWLSNVKIPEPVRRAAIETIEVWVWQFRLDRDRATGTPNGRAFREWVRGAVRRLQEFEAWLQHNPLPQPVQPAPSGDLAEQLTWQRQHVAQQVEYFREWLVDVYDPTRGPGQPLDVPKADLVEAIGEVLFIAGRRPTRTESGVYFKVVQTVLADLGELDPNVSVDRALRDAIANRAHWSEGGGDKKSGKENLPAPITDASQARDAALDKTNS